MLEESYINCTNKLTSRVLGGLLGRVIAGIISTSLGFVVSITLQAVGLPICACAECTSDLITKWYLFAAETSSLDTMWQPLSDHSIL